MLNIINSIQKLTILLLIFLSLSITNSNSQSLNKNVYCLGTNYSNFNFNNKKNISFIKIDVQNKEKWFRNSLKALSSKSFNDSISKKRKKRFKASIIVYFKNGQSCKFRGKVRLHGDLKDHLKFKEGNFLSSLDVKISNGHINSIRDFKLYLPRTRFGVNEILITELFKELDVLAPETFLIDAEINGLKSYYLFQEKVSKEMIEKNLKREGPIFEGLEDSANSNAIITRIFLTRMINSRWILKNESNREFTLNNFNKLNMSYLAGENSFDRRFFIDHKFLYQNLEKFKIYEPILYAIGYPHGLGKNNRKFFFNILSGEFEPIYYDGDIKQINDFKLKIDSDVLKLTYPFIIDNSLFALQKIEEINYQNFYKKNKEKFVGLSEGDIYNFFENIKYNLKYLSKVEHKKIDREKLSLIDTFSKINKKEKLITTLKDKNLINVCDNLFISCNHEIISEDFLLKLISGTAKKDTEVYYLFSHYDKIKSDLENNEFIENFYKTNPIKKDIEITKIDGFNIISNQDIIIKINKEEKKIELNQITNMGRVIFEGDKIEEWSISFKGNKNFDDSKTILNLSNRLLTGCITFYDIQIQNLNVFIDGSVCEDALNVVTSHGNFDKIEILNSSSDALDFDFSSIEINDLKVERAINDCADFSAGNYEINFFNLLSCGDKAISVGEKSILKTTSGKIDNSTYGIVSKDSSIVNVSDVVLENIKICFAAYNKKEEFSGGLLSITNSYCNNYTIKEQIDKFSKIKS